MSDAHAVTNHGENDADRDASADELTTDPAKGADQKWPDEAKVVPDPYLGNQT